MNLNMHITSQSFVQSYRRFERNSYVHTSSTSDTAGIGFPHHYSHSYFYRASQQRAPQRIKIIRKSWSFLAGRIQLFLFSQMLGFCSDMARKSWISSSFYAGFSTIKLPLTHHKKTVLTQIFVIILQISALNLVFIYV